MKYNVPESTDAENMFVCFAGFPMLWTLFKFMNASQGGKKITQKKGEKSVSCNSSTAVNAKESIALAVEVALFNPLFISAENKQVDSWVRPA